MKRILAVVLVAVLVVSLLALVSGSGISMEVSAAPLAAATPISVQTISLTPAAPSFAAASTDGNTFTNDGRTFIEIKNTSGVTVTATIVTQVTVGGNAVADKTVTVPPTTGDVVVGPFLPEIYNDSTGATTVTWSATSGVTMAVLKY